MSNKKNMPKESVVGVVAIATFLTQNLTLSKSAIIVAVTNGY
jgi:hypothetical protein